MLTLRPPKEMHFVILVNANFATKREERKSVTGGIYMLGGCIIAWNSKTQSQTAISLTEAEYYTISQGAQELSFLKA